MDAKQKRLLKVIVVSIIIIELVALYYYAGPVRNNLTRSARNYFAKPNANAAIYKEICSNASEAKKDLCQSLLYDMTEVELSGNQITIHRMCSDCNSTTYNINTGKVVEICGFWIGSMTQGSPCATPSELEHIRKNR